MITEDNMPKNIGKIKVATKFLSSKLKASFETVSSIKPMRIFITAENDASVQYTDYEVILTTNNF
jgi:nicotinamide riboside kinase